jgi:antirestriction protein ArdC
MERTTTSEPKTLDWREMINTALTMPGNVGNTYNRFYSYSYTNQVYLMMQGVTEPVATYKRWQQLGRQVQRGSKAKEIVRPLIFEQKDEAGHVTERKVRFKPVKCLFTVSETDGDPLPPFEAPEWKYERALGALGITEVPFRVMDGNTAGYSYDRNVAINPVAVNPNKTRIHELGHITLGHTQPDGMELYKTHRGPMEFQAESTAYLVMNELEMMTETEASESRGYVQTWLRGYEPPSDTLIRQVFNATDTILKAGRAALGEVDIS